MRNSSIRVTGNLLLACFICAAIPALSNDRSTFDAILDRLSSDNDTSRCVELPAAISIRGVTPRGLDNEMRRALFARTDVDVSPIGFATLMDITAEAKSEPPVYGVIDPAAVAEQSPRSASINNFNSVRDVLGLVPIEVQEQVYSDYAAIGISVEDLLEERSIYDCRYPRDINSAKFELASILAGASSARAAWAANQYRTSTESHEAVRIQDQLGAQWVAKYLTDGAYRNNSALTRRDLQSVFLLLQHSGDISLMLRALPWLADRMLEGRISRSNYSTVVDRILVFQNRPQIYGTQGRDDNGVVVPYPIGRPGEIEARRRLMYLQPIEQYYKLLNE